MDSSERLTAKLAAELIEGSGQREAISGFRADVLELATRLELAIDEVLAAAVARDASSEVRLRLDVYWRMTSEVRVAMLKDLLDRQALLDSFPLLPPVLSRFFRFRHQLAHGIVHGVSSDRGSHRLRITVVKKGRPQVESLAIDEVAWLVVCARRAEVHLARVWAGVAPSTKRWYE